MAGSPARTAVQTIVLLVCSLSLSPILPALAQTALLGIDSTGNTFRSVYPAGTIVHTLAFHDTVRAVRAIHTFDLNEVVSVIVELEEPPLSAFWANATGAGKQQASLAAARARIEAEQYDVRAALARLVTAGPTYEGLSPATLQVSHAYQGVFNGLALRTRRWMLGKIARLPDVKHVHADRIVSALDDESNTRIRADLVRTQLGASGVGQLIAVLDTGIDYMHPALGGGIGPGRKVVGGYDFVNMDDNPQDDHGHGTHVAGIAAADAPTLHGVAPAARLLAVKVLDQYGNGQESQIIAGIEYAMDPDGNLETDDGADVINLSLGGPGGPDDPLSKAVDNAARRGVLCVVAAGNSGFGNYQTIGSPGAARDALTVGASDRYDQIAAFSSRGPVVPTFAMKPDLVAPGVDLDSASPGGGHTEMTGTSMATPLVAGAVALLKELHPDWTPAMLKAALMQTAVDLREDVLTQGRGRVDVYNAARAAALLVPASLSPGLVDLTQPIWTWRDTLRIVNTGTEPEAFTLQTEGLPPGATADVSPNSVLLSPGESAVIAFSLRADNAVLAMTRTPLPGHQGQLVARSATRTLTVPFTFVKSPGLALHFTGRPIIAWVFDAEGRYWVAQAPSAEAYMLLPQGTYDVVTLFDDGGFREVYHEDVEVRGTRHLDVDAAAAKHKVHLHVLAPDKRDLSLQGVELVSTHQNTFTSSIHLSPGTPSFDIWYSDASTDYVFDYYLYPFDHPSFPDANFVEGSSLHHIGVEASLDLHNDPDRDVFTRQELSFPSEPDLSGLFVTEWICRGNGCFAYYDTEPGTPNLRRAPFRWITYRKAQEKPTFTTHVETEGVNEALPTWPDDPFYFRYHLPWMYTTPEQIYLYHLFDSKPVFSMPRQDELPLAIGTLLPRWMGTIWHDGGTIYVSGSSHDSGSTMGLFLDPIGTIRSSLVPFELSRSDLLVQKGTIRSGRDGDFFQRIGQRPSGSYALTLRFDKFYVAGRQGEARAIFTIAANTAPKISMALRTFALYANGFLASTVASTDENVLAVQVDDGQMCDAALSYRPNGQTAWSSLAVEKSDSLLRAVLPTTLASGFYDLRVDSRDAAGNTLRYEVEPAFFVTGPSPPVPLSPPDGARDLRLLPEVAWKSLPNVGRYHLQVAADTAFTQLVFEDSTVTDLSRHVPGLDHARTYHWRVRARDDLGAGAWSPSRRFTTVVAPPNTVHLTTPEDGARDQASRLTLCWEPAEGAERYHVRVGTALAAGEFAADDSTLSEPTYATGVLPYATTLVWQVRAGNRGGWGPWSSPFRFTVAVGTGVERVSEEVPHVFALHQTYPNPFNATTVVPFDVPEASEVTVEIFDALGRRVANLVSGLMMPGRYHYRWMAVGLPSGLYLCRMKASTFVQTQTLLYLK